MGCVVVATTGHPALVYLLLLLQELQLFLLSGHSLRVDVGFTALIKYPITDWRLLMVVAGCVPEVTREAQEGITVHMVCGGLHELISN